MNQSLPTAPKRVYFSGLNALRCFAAMAIVVYHASGPLQEAWGGAVKMIFHNLTIGVDLFFIISGFLIIYLLLHEKQETKTISLSKFYLRRALRILPLYFLILGLAYYQSHETNPEIDFKKYFLFVGNFWMIEHNGWTIAALNPLWSLCIEEQFYFIIPVLILLIPTRRVPDLLVGVMVLSLAFRAYIEINVELEWMPIYCHTLSRCDLLALGGLLAYRHFTKPIELKLSDWTFWLQVFLLVVLMAIVDYSNYETFSYATVKKYLFTAPLVFVFCFLVFNQSSTASVLNTNRIIDYLGKVSFGIYMYHGPIIEALAKNNIQVPVYPLYLQPLLIIALTIAAAALSYELFEKQILRLKSRFEVIRTRKSLQPTPEPEQVLA